MPVTHQMPRRRGSAAWTPASEGASLVSWWRGDAMTTSVMTDKSGNGFTASVAAGSPAMTTLNGKAAITLTAAAHFDGSTNLVTAGSAHTVCFAGAATNGSGGCVLSLRKSAQYQGNLVLDLFGNGWTVASNNYFGGDGVTTPANVQLTTAPGAVLTAATGFHFVWAWPASGGTPNIYINGIQYTVSSGVNITETGTAGWMIGDNSANQAWQAIVGDLAVFDHQFSSTEVTNWTSYAHSYWSI